MKTRYWYQVAGRDLRLESDEIIAPWKQSERSWLRASAAADNGMRAARFLCQQKSLIAAAVKVITTDGTIVREYRPLFY